MGVLPIIALMYIEILAAVIGLGAFLFLFIEYLRTRRNKALPWAAAYLLSISAGGLLMFVGQLLYAYDDTSLARTFLTAEVVLVPISSIFLPLVAVENYLRERRAILTALFVTLGLISITAALSAEKEIVTTNGLSAPHAIGGVLPVIYLSWLIAAVFLTWRAYRSWSAPESAATRSFSDRYLYVSGVCGIVFFAVISVAGILNIEWLAIMALGLMLAHIVYLFFGIAARDHESPEVRQHPINIINRRLMLKAVGFTVLLFSMFAFLLTAVTASYFVAELAKSHETSRARDLRFITKSYASYSISLLEETMRLAALPQLVTSAKEKTRIPHEVLEQFQQRGNERIIRIVNEEGKVMYSSYSPTEIGFDLSSSGVVQKAIKGSRVAAAENEVVLGRWVVRAAAPVASAGEPTGYVVLSTDIAGAFDIAEYGDINASGYGFFSEKGEHVYSVGDDIDAITRVFFEKKLARTNIAQGETDDGSSYNIQRIFATDGSPDGFFYIFVGRQLLELQIVRILTVVVVIILLFFTVIIAILIFCIGIVLRPIKSLAMVASQIEGGNYDVQVEYDSSDELGVLARAINKMAKTIGDRTLKLQNLLQTQRDFMAHTAHEMRTPLNIFRWTLELMRFGDMGRLNREQMELLEQLHQTNQRLLNMVDNLRVAASLDQNHFELKREFIAIEDSIDEVAGALAIKIREKNQTLHWNKPASPLSKVYADKQRLYQVLLNLISNSVKYTGKNGHIEITLDPADNSGPERQVQGKFLKVTVEDSGPGIPKDEQDRVFSRFFRSRDVLKTEIEGTGLGLFITKQLVDFHGGEIWFESAPGIGTAFHFTIPHEKPYDVSVEKGSKAA